MADLFKKLNTLIRASLSELGSPPAEKDERPRLVNQLDRDLHSLYARVEDTERFQRELQQRRNALESQLSDLDSEIDAALEQGQKEHARYLQEQANRARQRLVMTEADLREHQRTSSELAYQVHQLETALDETRQRLRQRGQDTQQPPAPEAARKLDDISLQLRSAREKLAGPTPAPGTPRPDDDLDARIQRLSRK